MSFSIGGFPDDDYLIYVTEGEEWDGVEMRFTHLVALERFRQILDFGTIVSGPQTTYTVWTITLGSRSGPAVVDDVVPDDFPSLR